MKTRELKKYPIQIILMTFAFCVTMLIPILFSYLIDEIVLAGAFDKLIPWLAVTLPVILVGTAMNFYVISYMPVKIGIINTFVLQRKALRNILKMNQPAYARQDKGYYFNITMNSCASYGDMYEEMNLNLIANLIYVAAILAFVTWVNWVFGIFFLVYGVVLVLLSILESSPFYQMNKEVMIVQDVYMNDMRNIIENKSGINALHSETFFEGVFDKSVEKFEKFMLKYRFWNYLAEFAPSGINQIFSILFLFVSAYLVQRGQITTGIMLMGYSYLGYIVTPITTACQILIRYKSNLVNIERVDQLEEKAAAEKENTLNKQEKNLLCRAEKFHFYKGEQPEDFLFHIEELNLKKNGLYVIKGENGSGKSMLLNLMLGNVSPKNSKGTLSLAENMDDTILLSYPTFAVNGTFEENLFGCKRDRELEKILNIDFADKEITSNPVNLSYGQQQKLALLRVFLRNSPILFLDEPLSNLDVETQESVINYIRSLKGKKTILLIMHSDEMDSFADGIFKIENKSLKAVGNPT